MDVVGRFHLADGTEVKVVTGVDDHSRFCVCARVVARATARPVCEALQWALRTHGVPDQILTDNGKVFTARFGQGPGPVLFDRICANNGIRHLLTAPYSPTTTGKVERFHKTMRSDFLVDHDRVHATIEELQSALDEWVDEYNTKRPHQSLGDRPPIERFALAAAHRPADLEMPEIPDEVPLSERPPGVNRWVDQRGSIGLGGLRYRVGATFAGETVEVVVRSGLVEILHAGVLVATHAERRRADKGSKPQRAARAGRSRPPTSGMSVTRRVDGAARSPSPVPAIGSGAAGPASSSRWPSWPARSRSRPRARSSGSTPSATTAPRSTAPSPRPRAGPVRPRSPEGLSVKKVPEPDRQAGTGT